MNLREIRQKLLQGCKCALADLEGLLPDADPEGTHPERKTVPELRAAIKAAETPRKRERKHVWTFLSDSCGYTLYCDGRQRGGVRTEGTATHTSDGRRRAWQHVRADRLMYYNRAKEECAKRNREGLT